MQNAIKRHPMYSSDDHQYLRNKGYSDAEIRKLWDRDAAAGKVPVHHKKPFDIVGFLSQEIQK